MKIQEITDRSWLLENDSDSVCLITQRNSGEYLLISGGRTLEFLTLQELNEHLEKNLLAEVETPDQWSHNQQWLVKGYPVNHHAPLEVELDHDLPLFAKRTGTDVCMCAGYYCVRSDVGWRGVFCPKLTTLQRYEYCGPFHTRTEMQQHLKNLKNKHHSC